MVGHPFFLFSFQPVKEKETGPLEKMGIASLAPLKFLEELEVENPAALQPRKDGGSRAD
jgi:hypothetical protein